MDSFSRTLKDLLDWLLRQIKYRSDGCVVEGSQIKTCHHRVCECVGVLLEKRENQSGGGQAGRCSSSAVDQ